MNLTELHQDLEEGTWKVVYKKMFLKTPDQSLFIADRRITILKTKIWCKYIL